MNIYSMPDQITYDGVAYTILDTLNNSLLLVAETAEIERGVYPIKPLIIPNRIVD